MKKNNTSVKTVLSLYIALTIMAACVLLCAVYLWWEWNERKADLAEHVKWMAANAALLSVDGISSGSTAALNDISRLVVNTERDQHLFDSDDMEVYMEVLDSRGDLLAAADINMSEMDRSVMAARRPVAARSVSAGEWFEELSDGCGLYGAYYPVYSGGARVGTVSVGLCDTPARMEIMGSAREAALLLAAAGLLGVLVGRKIAGRFSGPVAELVRGAGELSSGNLEYRVELDSYREMQILASSFNTMAWNLKEKIRGLDDARLDAVGLNEKLARALEEARLAAAKLEQMNEWTTDMAFSLEEANQLLKEEMVQTRTIVHSIKEGIVAVDRNENIILMNPEAEDLFGVRLDDARGQNVRLLVDALVGRIAEPQAFLDRFMASAATPGSDSEFSITVTQPFRKVLKRRSSAIRGDGGDVIGRVITFTDITREKEVDDMKTNFVSTVSHELRTPLTSIKGALTLLRDADMADQDQETRSEFLSIAENNTDRLIGLITNLLDLARIESGMAALNLSRVDINKLVTGIVRLSDIMAAREGVALEVDCRAGAPEVLADSSKMEQVIANLIDNAVKFSAEGGRVRVSTRDEDGELVIAVEDDGPGIPGDKLGKVFEKFYQVDMSATRKVGGSGLGLAICKAVVSEHGGDIRAVSPVMPGGTGTRFEVRLPATGIKSRRTGDRRALADDVSISAGTASEDTVLLVDDDEAILKLQRTAFEKQGYRVFTAGTGRDALMLARENLPGFIFLDVRLPDLDGITVAGILKRDPVTSAIPIVFATGHLDEDDIRGLEFGSRVIRKPFVEEELISAVKEYYG